MSYAGAWGTHFYLFVSNREHISLCFIWILRTLAHTRSPRLTSHKSRQWLHRNQCGVAIQIDRLSAKHTKKTKASPPTRRMRFVSIAYGAIQMGETLTKKKNRFDRWNVWPRVTPLIRCTFTRAYYTIVRMTNARPASTVCVHDVGRAEPQEKKKFEIKWWKLRTNWFWRKRKWYHGMRMRICLKHASNKPSQPSQPTNDLSIHFDSTFGHNLREMCETAQCIPRTRLI